MDEPQVSADLLNLQVTLVDVHLGAERVPWDSQGSLRAEAEPEPSGQRNALAFEPSTALLP